MSSDLVTQLILGALGVLGLLIRRSIKTPSDAERAALLAQLARDAAAIVVSLAPGKSWAEMVKMVVEQLSGYANLPTRNSAAIQRAATRALMDLGKRPIEHQ